MIAEAPYNNLGERRNQSIMFTVFCFPVPQDTFVRPAHSGDEAGWLGLRQNLWSKDEVGGLLQEMMAIIADPKRQAAFIAETSEGEIVGFIEVSIHEKVDWCKTRHVGYLEGWYVARSHRGSGIGRRLIEAAEDWARRQGCHEMASDTTRDYPGSPSAHRKVGFEEIKDLPGVFRKELTGG